MHGKATTSRKRHEREKTTKKTPQYKIFHLNSLLRLLNYKMVSGLQRQRSGIASQQPVFSVKETMLGKAEAVNINNNNNNNKYSNSKNVNLCTKYYP